MFRESTGAHPSPPPRIVHSEQPCLARGDADFRGHIFSCFFPADEMHYFVKYLSKRIAVASVERCIRRYWFFYLAAVLSLTKRLEVEVYPGMLGRY
jgi:hypothetical protein